MVSTDQADTSSCDSDQPQYVNHGGIREQQSNSTRSSRSSDGAVDLTIDRQSPSSSSTLELRRVSITESSNPAAAAEASNNSYRHRLVCVCAFLLLAVGVLSVTISGVEQIFNRERIVREAHVVDTQSFIFYGCGYWSGPVYIIAGIVGIVSGKYRTNCLIISYLIACIISGFTASVQCIIGVVGCVHLTRHRNNVYIYLGSYAMDNTDIPLAMNAGSATLAVVALVTSFISVCCCSSAVDRTCAGRRRLKNSSKHEILPHTSPRDTVFDTNGRDQTRSDNSPTFKSFTAEETAMPIRLYPNLDELRVEVRENSLQQTLSIRDPGPSRSPAIIPDAAADADMHSLYYDDIDGIEQCSASVPRDGADHVIIHHAIPVTSSCQYCSSGSGLIPSAPPLDLLLEDESGVESIYDELDTTHSFQECSLGQD